MSRYYDEVVGMAWLVVYRMLLPLFSDKPKAFEEMGVVVVAPACFGAPGTPQQFEGSIGIVITSIGHRLCPMRESL